MRWQIRKLFFLSAFPDHPPRENIRVIIPDPGEIFSWSAYRSGCAGKGIFVDFFGNPAHTANDPAFLSFWYILAVSLFFKYHDDNDICCIHAGDITYLSSIEKSDYAVALLTV